MAEQSFSEKIISYVLLNVFRFKAPKARNFVVGLVEKRKTDIDAKKVKAPADFNEKFSKSVKPYWKQFGVKAKKNPYKVFWAEGESSEPRYIPNDIWIKDIIPHFNNIYEYRNLGDKSLQELLVQGVAYPETIVKRAFGIYYDAHFKPLKSEEVCKLLREAEQAVIKQSFYSYGGLGVSFIKTKEMTDSDILSLLGEYTEDIVIQKAIKQHPALSAINETSINTIRLITFYYKGEVKVLSSVLRMGGSGSKTDNITGGGYACGINENGRLFDKAISRTDGWQTHHSGGMAFNEVVIPNYKEIVEKIKAAAERVPYFKILGWDIAVDENAEPVVIEYNVIPEQNQKIFGPTFGKLSDEILKEVYNK